MIGVHHSAICTADIELALRFWRDGLGLHRLFDHNFTGDWPELFGADSDRLRSIFLGDPQSPDSGIVELVELPGADAQLPTVARPRHGFFLLSLQRDVEAALSALAAAGLCRPCPAHRRTRTGRQDRRDGRHHRTRRCSGRADRAGAVSVALVTGGGSGIGCEVAERLRAAGHDVVVWDLSGGDIDCDISDPDAVSAAMERTVRDRGVPTRVVTCAGVGASGMLVDQSPAQWERVLAVNLTGTWLTLRAAALAMIGAGGGRFDRCRFQHQRHPRRSGHGGLLRVESGGGHVSEGRRRGVGESRHPGERRGTRRHSNTDVAKPRTAARAGSKACPSELRWAGWVKPPTWPGPSSVSSNYLG